MQLKTIKPDWPAPAGVVALTAKRHDEFLDREKAKQNPIIWQQELNLPSMPIWIKQTHSNVVLPAISENIGKEADATFSDQANQVCAVFTADCIPILICNRQGTHVAAIHAGWRGLENGIINTTLSTLNLPAEELLVWLGPAIGPNHFEVGDEVKQLFLQKDANTEQAFTPSDNARWMANIYTLAKLQLLKFGVNAIYGGEYCTYSNKECFFSYRRDGVKTGHMVSLIYFSKEV